jgi:hypothetical protein
VSAPDAVGPEAAFIVAPNPAQHAVTITLRRPQQARMEVLNALGECVSAHAFTGTSAVIDLGQLSPGTYLIRMHGASDAGYAKLMLVR